MYNSLRLGLDQRDKKEETMEKTDILIIGGGLGGYTTALTAALQGLSVRLIEKTPRLGGTCLNNGCIPSKVLLDSSEHYDQARHKFMEHGITVGDVQMDVNALMARKEGVIETLSANIATLLKRHKIDMVTGTAKVVTPNEVAVTNADSGITLYGAEKAIVLAAGSVALRFSFLPFDDEYIITSDEALSFTEVPKRLGVIGGGAIGLELGSVWQRLGSKVTVIEALDNIAPTMDAQISRTLNRYLKAQGMDLRVKTRLVSARVENKEVLTVVSSNDQEETLVFDKLLVAVGRRPATAELGLEDVGVELTELGKRVVVNEKLETTVKGIYAIGDLTDGPMLAHKASAEAHAVVNSILEKPLEIRYDVMPGVIYTWPEAAGVGLTEEELKLEGRAYQSVVIPFTGSGRAQAAAETDGQVKVICDGGNQKLLGVHLIGPRAADMIDAASVAISAGMTVHEVHNIICAHPSFSEVWHEACLAVAMTPAKGGK